MNVASGIVLSSLLLGTNVSAAEHHWPTAPRAQGAAERVSIAVSSRAGLVTRPFVTTAFPEVSGFGVALTGAAAVRVSPVGWFHLQVPVSVVRLDLPAGAQMAETALGNVELGLTHGIHVHPSTRLAVLATWIAPSAEHGPRGALSANRALALASALEGDTDSSLLTPGVSGVRLGGSIEHTHRALQFRASLEMPLLIRISEASLPDDVETHPIGFMPAIDARGAWWITPGLGLSLGLGLLTEPLRVQEPARALDRRRRLQGLVEPGVHLQLGQHTALALDASVPVGGSLGGEAWSIGFQGRLGL